MAYQEDFTVEGLIEWQGGFDEMGYQLTPDLAVTLYWERRVWIMPGSQYVPYYLVQVERTGRNDLWLWCGEPIARRIFAEAFSQVPVPQAPATPPAAAKKPLRQAIQRTKAVTHPPHTAAIAAPGWDFASISAPCFN